MTDEISQAVLDNKALPLRDVENVPAGLFREQAALDLASYLEEGAALARAAGAGQPPFTGLLAADPANHRYTVAIAQTEDGSQGDERYAVPAARLEWSRNRTARLRTSAVVAVDRNAGARDQFQAAIRRAIPAASITGAADLDAGVALIVSIDGALKFAGAARIGFDYNWMREVAAGQFAADLGLAVATGMEASVEASLSGSFWAAVTLDEQRRLRVRLFEKNGSGLTVAAKVAAQAGASDLAGGAGELAAALLGMHYTQWLESVERAAAAGTAEAAAARIGVSPAALGRFFERWNRIEGRAAEAIWSAAGGPALEQIRQWAHRAASELESPADFQAALGKAIESDPGFVGSPAGTWIDAAAGGLLAAAVDSGGFQKLSSAAAAADALLGDAEAAATLARLKEYAARALNPASLETADEWVRQQLGIDPAAKVRAALEAARSICEKAGKALANRYSAEVAYRLESNRSGTALIDCSFEFTPEGLELYRECLAGDFSRTLRAGSPAALRQAVLTHGMRRQVSLELHLPFMDRTESLAATEALAKLDVETGEDGRLFAYTIAASDRLEKKNAYQSVLALAGSLLAGARKAGDFTLSFTDRRTLRSRDSQAVLGPVLSAYDFGPGPQEWLGGLPKEAATVDTSLTLSLPASAGACWLRAPGERDQQFVPVYSEMSVAVQRAMRKWLPMAWFAEIDHYDDLGAAFPLLVYQALPPLRGKRKSELAYDAMDLESARLGRASVLRNLAAQLEVIRPLLVAAGKRKKAKYYSPYQAQRIIASVERHPRQLLALLAADASFVDSLVNLGVSGGGLAATLEGDPGGAVKQLAAFSARLVSALHRKLRCLYGGQNFVAFGSLLFMEATRALGASLSAEAKVAGILQLSAVVDGQSIAKQTYVNAAFRP
jgi:DNA-binding transcriptional regulator YdaS (Cro superfamily)